jgi:hypothetical protein
MVGGIGDFFRRGFVPPHRPSYTSALDNGGMNLQKIHRWIGSVAVLVVAASLLNIFPQIASHPDKVRVARTMTELQICGQELDAWSRGHGRVPTEQEGFALLKTKKCSSIDEWGNPIAYKNIAGEMPIFLLFSFGPNGVNESGSGDDIIYIR